MSVNVPAVVGVDAGGVLVNKFVDYVIRHAPSGQEKRGDKRLEDARILIIENEPLIDSGDLPAIEGKITFAREMKLGLDSKWGLPRLLHAREYRKAAKSAYYAAKTASDRGRDGVIFRPRGLDSSSVHETSEIWHDHVTDVARSLFKIYFGCKDAFPAPQMKDEWTTSVWREACAKTGADPILFPPYAPFTNSNIDLFTETKNRTMHAVEALYGFDSSHAADSISRNATLAQALLTDMAFIYRGRNPGENPHHPYRHPALQKAINITWFQNKDDDGVVFHEHFSPLSIPAIAFILAVIECCIDEWADGTHKNTRWGGERFKDVYQSHIGSLIDFRERGITQGADLFELIRGDLLREARKHAGVPAVPVTELGRFSSDALDAAHREDLPAYTAQGIQIPSINIVSDDSEEDDSWSR